MIALGKQVIASWWQESRLSCWYVAFLARKHAINLALYGFDAKNRPTLKEFMLRRYASKPAFPSTLPRMLHAPVEGTILKHDERSVTLKVLLHHYHRIHLPLGGSITHYTRAPYTTSTIHITSPDGTFATLTIQTAQPYGAVLHYNTKRNYHLPGTEIGCIYTREALVTLHLSPALSGLHRIGSTINCFMPLAHMPSTPPFLAITPQQFHEAY